MMTLGARKLEFKVLSSCIYYCMCMGLFSYEMCL